MIAKEKVGVVYLLAAAMLWGTCGTPQMFVPQGYDPMAVGMMRSAIGGAILFFAGCFSKRTGPCRDRAGEAVFTERLFRSGLPITFFNAVDQTGVAIGTIVGLGSAPIFSGFAWFLAPVAHTPCMHRQEDSC